MLADQAGPVARPGPGPVALVGSGEYRAVMADLEGSLLKGRAPRYVQLPTAAGEEGPESIDRWVGLGREQAHRLGVEPVPVLALDRHSADDPALAGLVGGAGLIYLSGGSPSYLAATLRGTRVWEAVVREWRAGAALAGCSAGAIALTGWVPDIRQPSAVAQPGLGVVPGIRVLAHFDRLRARSPGMASELAAALPAGGVLVGVDEETAVVSNGADLSTWVVHGRQAAWVYTTGPPARQPLVCEAGEEFIVGPGF